MFILHLIALYYGGVSMIIPDERMSDFFSEDNSLFVLDYDGMRHTTILIYQCPMLLYLRNANFQ